MLMNLITELVFSFQPASARGIGIQVVNRFSQIPIHKRMIVQKYVAKPYLLDGTKFDLRIYVLVTSFCPLRIYVYEDGLVRFASRVYSFLLHSTTCYFDS